ncbi:MAG TPA: hypothetical protein DD379_07675 [Cyanobacteria bacterium UBA11162]|nr:hypothetical protein [Cyanobacteria bacterium UBA11162]
MWKPLKLASWFGVIAVAWSIGYVYNARYGGELSWLRMMYERKMALAAEVDAPRRLLITGGSGAHYTINSKLMEQELGIPVLNLGIDGPVGLDVILPSILSEVRKGDIVLLIPEYLILWSEDGLGDRSANFGLAIGRPGLGGVPPKRLAQDTLLLGTPTLRGVTKSTLDLIEKGKLTGYYSDPVDERGDPTVTKERTGEWWELPINQPITKHAVKRIAQFKQEVEAKGGTLILSLPWVYARTDEKSVRNVEKTAEELSKIAPLLYDQKTLNMQTNSNLFADTHYHLKPEARELRAKQLVEELKDVLGSELTEKR